MDATQLNDFLASLKKCSEDYFKALMLSLISVTPSRQQKKKMFIVQQDLSIDETMLNSVCSDRCAKYIRSMIADLTIEVETLEQTKSDYPDYSCKILYKKMSLVNDLHSILRQSSISRDDDIYSKMKTIQIV